MPLVVFFSYGCAAFLVPLGMSSLNKEFGLRASLDILGAVFSVYAIVFTIHAAKNNRGRKRGDRAEEEDEVALIN